MFLEQLRELMLVGQSHADGRILQRAARIAAEDARDNIHSLMTTFGLQSDYMYGVFDLDGGQKVLSLIIPEPCTGMLLGLGALLLIRRRR
jgi:hypothetical protein